MSRKAVNVPSRKPVVKKELPPKPPNFPQHDLPQPYARLQEMGAEDFDEEYAHIAEELKRGDVNEAAQKLLAMALDETYYDYDEFYDDDDDYWKRETRANTRLHAVRTLALLGGAANIAIEPLLPLLDEDDDWLREDMPLFYGKIGKPAVETLTRLMADAAQNEFMRAGASSSLSEIGQAHPELRDEIVGILEQELATTDSPEVAGHLVCALLDVGAKESVSIIEKAYEDDRVDRFIVGMDSVIEHFDLPRPVSEEEAQSVPLPIFAMSDDADDDYREPYVAPPTPGRNEPCTCGSGKKYKKCHGA